MSHIYHRMLGRKSSHRVAMLRNLVQSLLEHESIRTTYPRAKEAQREAEKLITLAKKNTEASRNEALKYLYIRELNSKLFGSIRERYANRAGGYTRVLHIEPYNDDAAPSAILELVDGPKDMRFAMAAKTVAYHASMGLELNPITLKNVEKVTRFRQNGKEEFQKVVDYFMAELEKKKGGESGSTADGGLIPESITKLPASPPPA